MKFRAKNSLSIAYLLNLAMPGLGHALWRECLFGIFVYLIMLIAAALFFISFFFSFNIWAKLALFGMPAIFFIFSFVDLSRSVRTARAKHSVSDNRAYLFALIGLLHLLLVPISPVNFLIRNRPTVFEVTDNDFSPELKRGQYAFANSLTYKADLFFLDRPVVYEIPEFFDLVRFSDQSFRLRTGMVVGRPQQMVEIQEGLLFANGMPVVSDRPLAERLSGDWPLTAVDSYSILIATLRHGSIDTVMTVPLTDVQGKVDRLF